MRRWQTVFRSRRRDVVFTQYEHARLAGELALAWHPDDIPLPFDAWVRGVALHDRGYDVVDADDIFAVSTERWLEIQRRGIVPREENPVVDLVVALHVRRLMGRTERAELAAELDALLPNLRAASGVDEAAALAADAVTDVCDRISFDFCLEEPAVAQVRGISYTVDGNGRVTMEPWPLGVPRIAGLVYAYRADGYPERLEPVVVAYEVVPK
jgi:Protein of unknown function (DUF3891)